MSQKYFDNVPNIYYNNKLCKDITRRVKLVDSTRNSPFIFYPYEIKHQLRSDVIADYYYGDSYLDWLIYFSNKIIDPYYGWYLDDNKLGLLIRDKYGSFENSVKRIRQYFNNWVDDPTELTPAFYNEELAPRWRKYYMPNWSPATNRIISYRRKPLDIVVNTNRIIDLAISANNNSSSLSEGELIDVRSTPANTIATAEVITANTSVVRIKNVDGNTFCNSTITRTVVGETAGANITINDQTIVIENIPLDEEVFWTAQSFYDYEVEQNESKKTIVLASSGVKDLLIQQFFDKLAINSDPLTRLANTQ